MTSLMGQCQIKRLLQASVYKYRWSPGDVIRVQIVPGVLRGNDTGTVQFLTNHFHTQINLHPEFSTRT